VGLTGTLLNSRSILAFYALLLWPSFVSILVVGYTSYKREAFSLDRKLNMAWSQWYDDLGRLLIQESVRNILFSVLAYSHREHTHSFIVAVFITLCVRLPAVDMM